MQQSINQSKRRTYIGDIIKSANNWKVKQPDVTTYNTATAHNVLIGDKPMAGLFPQSAMSQRKIVDEKNFYAVERKERFEQERLRVQCKLFRTDRDYQTAFKAWAERSPGAAAYAPCNKDRFGNSVSRGAELRAAAGKRKARKTTKDEEL